MGKINAMKVQLPFCSGKNSVKIICVLPLLAMLLAGCAAKTPPGAMLPPEDPTALSGARFHAGDTVIVAFDGLPENPTTQEKTVNEDGTVTLSDVGVNKVVGKTTGELETIIHDKYVPQFYNHLTVTVKAGERVFYVRGEVANKSRQVYVGQLTVTKAIAAAGDFTDFANHKNVLLIRASGQRFVLNCDAILRGEALDPPVYPGDQIEVRRRRF